ncbi:hypothetical protein Pla22_52360 [Rubripirellula amarantea]|uniref:Uncharacterized protein n=1 Tax=Rubripirellula amarantea TaxID=2527999 RepID=A0A5C5WCV3_9BACT|nr:hypothetical protein Pla22_52360 [Rubripirellula amarantea]
MPNHRSYFLRLYWYSKTANNQWMQRSGGGARYGHPCKLLATAR